MSDSPHLIACPDCDLLQLEVILLPGRAACCSRCGALLYRNSTDSLNRTLAFSVSAAIIFIVANIYPLLGMGVWGDYNSVTLFGACDFIWRQRMPLMASTVFLTTIVVPAMELSLLLYLLVPLRYRKVPPGAASVLRLLRRLKAWSMLEVFLLGSLVSIAKLRADFNVDTGVGIWALAALILLFAGIAATFNVRAVWSVIEQVDATESRS